MNSCPTSAKVGAFATISSVIHGRRSFFRNRNSWVDQPFKGAVLEGVERCDFDHAVLIGARTGRFCIVNDRAQGQSSLAAASIAF